MRFLLVSLVCLALLGCADPTYAPMHPDAAQVGDDQPVIVVTNRAREPSGFFGGHRSDQASYMTLGVSIPTTRELGSIPLSYRRAVPGQHFVMTDSRPYGGRAEFRRSLARALQALPPSERDITLYVHGYNTSFSDGVFRTAQLMHDFELAGLGLHYSWPSTAHPLGYSHDRDSLLFARDGLEDLLRDVSMAGARNVVLVGHSLGAMLVMESLRQMDIADPGLPDRILDGVVLISPDIDLDLFKAQAGRIRALPDPFAIFVSQKDRALQLSSRINGRSKRLGTLADAADVADLNVMVFDVTAFSTRAAQSHFLAGSSPALIQLLSRGAELDESFATMRSARRGGLPGVALTVQNATQIILSPGLFGL